MLPFVIIAALVFVVISSQSPEAKAAAAIQAVADNATAAAETRARNAANEIAVEAFLEERINFVDFPRIIDKILNTHNSIKDPSLEDILNADEWARTRTKELIERIIS